MLREHLIALTTRTELLPSIAEQAFIDIDSLLRPVYGHAKQGASYGHTKIAGKQILSKGLSPLAITISTQRCAPVIAGMRLRAGKTARVVGGWWPRPSLPPAPPAPRARSRCGATRPTPVRAIVRACRRGKAQFSLVMVKHQVIQRAIDSIEESAWTSVRYSGAVQDSDTGA